MSKYLAVLLAACLSGCGMKGSLELPPGTPPDPVFGPSKSRPAAPPVPADVSTDKNSRSE